VTGIVIPTGTSRIEPISCLRRIKYKKQNIRAELQGLSQLRVATQGLVHYSLGVIKSMGFKDIF
jgi:hypothetical protein